MSLTCGAVKIKQCVSFNSFLAALELKAIEDLPETVRVYYALSILS